MMDLTDLKIDGMKLTDLDEVMEIEETAFSMPWNRWLFERELRDQRRSHFLVARIGSEVIGYIGMWMAPEEAHIVTIAVRGDFRRKGVGSILMLSAMILADRLEAKRVTLEVRVTNIPAQNMYNKLGFEIISIRKGFYSDTGEDAYVMWITNLKEKIGEIRACLQNMLHEKEN